MEHTKSRPFLRWAGSKRQLLPVLRKYWTGDCERYVEPFAGSACLFFDLQPNTALLSDVNSELIATFRSVKRHPKRVATALAKLRPSKRMFYRIRREDPERLSQIDAAARFIFLNRLCFNGLFRTNLDGKFNVPFSGTRYGHIPTVEELQGASRLLECAELRAADFQEILDATRKGDFVYLDPPFAVGNRRVFRQYGAETFGRNDLQRLQKALRRMDRRGVAFVVSYALCREARETFAEWPQRKVFVSRNIAGFRKFRRRAAELIITNINS